MRARRSRAPSSAAYGGCAYRRSTSPRLLQGGKRFRDFPLLNSGAKAHGEEGLFLPFSPRLVGSAPFMLRCGRKTTEGARRGVAGVQYLGRREDMAMASLGIAKIRRRTALILPLALNLI